jgi:hypothetical protein
LTVVERTVVVLEPLVALEGIVVVVIEGAVRGMTEPGLMGVAELTVVVEWLKVFDGKEVLDSVVVMEGMVAVVVE